jgi:HK97 family phage major capsid protein
MKLSLPVGTGGSAMPVWHPGSDEDQVPDWLLGRPLYPTEANSTLGQKGDLILACWSEYIEGTYKPLQFVSSIHVRFAAFEQAFRFYARKDGAPWWRSALTPRRSTTTLSPFVVLGARA